MNPQTSIPLCRLLYASWEKVCVTRTILNRTETRGIFTSESDYLKEQVEGDFPRSSFYEPNGKYYLFLATLKFKDTFLKG